MRTHKQSVFTLSFSLQISLRQGMKADTGTLMSLCEKTDNDIRSCINTLQVGWQRCEGQSVCLHEQCSDVQYKYITHCVLVSSFTVVATRKWTSRPSSVSLWGRRTRTKACSICGRRSSSYSVQNGTLVSFLGVCHEVVNVFLDAETFFQKWPHSQQAAEE